ncbi:hypothetical protein MRX96_038730 [Rhipicephalus microplus]
MPSMEGSAYQTLSRLLLAVLVAISTVRLSRFGAYALYEDQAGKLDWRQRFIGKPLFVYADHSSVGSNQRIVVATEKNVLASLNTRNGALTWRQVLEQDGSMQAVSSSGDLITVSGSAPYVRAWDVHTGVLQWEKTLPHSSAPLGQVRRQFSLERAHSGRGTFGIPRRRNHLQPTKRRNENISSRSGSVDYRSD